MRRRKNDQRRNLRRSFRSIENLDGKGSSCTGWCFQTSNYMYRAPRSTLKIAHWTISFTRYRFGHGALRPRVRTTVPSSPIESSRTMVLVTKATRCHRPWISVVVEICWGSGWWKGWTRDGRTGEEKLSLSLSLTSRVYPIRVQMLFIETHGTSPRWPAAPSLRLEIYIPSNTLTDRKSASSATYIVDTSLADNYRESSSSFSSRGCVRNPRRSFIKDFRQDMTNLPVSVSHAT